MHLSERFPDSGYHRIPLTRSGVGHLHAAGTVNGRWVSVLLDTGGASTVISLTLARELGLTLTKVPFQGGGAGAGRLDVYHVPDGRLLLAGVPPQLQTLMAMDLSHVNQALALKGEAPVDAIVGADVFEAQGAVIDYASRSLFLKETV
ncbi:MAG TPA: aspartyl protease family protein [Gemmatimonadales bacterium]|nr:aspartyl protease family protein [Gemmatimonadales bacterium]